MHHSITKVRFPQPTPRRSAGPVETAGGTIGHLTPYEAQTTYNGRYQAVASFKDNGYRLQGVNVGETVDRITGERYPGDQREMLVRLYANKKKPSNLGSVSAGAVAGYAVGGRGLSGVLEDLWIMIQIGIGLAIVAVVLLAVALTVAVAVVDDWWTAYVTPYADMLAFDSSVFTKYAWIIGGFMVLAIIVKICRMGAKEVEEPDVEDTDD